MNANTAFQVTDTIGNAGTVTVDTDTTTADFIAWYTQGEGAPSSISDMLVDVLSGLFFDDRNSYIEDFLGLAIERA